MAVTLPVDASTVSNQMKQIDPSSPSSDYSASVLFWKMASDILAGAEAMRATSSAGRLGGPPIQFQNVPTQSFNALRGEEAQSPYLPKFPNEPPEEYARRRRNAFLTNVYGDISNNLSSKPFSKTCELAPETSEDLKNLAMNIDGLGNNMHVFARDVFKTAMDKGITWIMPDYTKVPPGSTLAAEREMGARAYWVHVPAEKLIAVYSKFLNGKEIIFHARIDELAVELDGYEEKTVKRVRELNRAPVLDATGKITGFEPAKFKVFQEDTTKDQATGKETATWNVVDEGDISIGVIPLVPVILGKREGTSWRITPPLRDLAYMQVKLFQMESNLDCTKELTAFPMLTGNGINGLDDKGQTIKVPVGPRGVLFAPANGSQSPGNWQFIEPSGASLTFLETCIDKHKTEMRDLGYQPLTAANLTVITTANISIKAHSAVQAWALMLKDALEQSWKITVQWLNKKVEPVVNVHTDFGVDMEAGTELASLTALETANVISKKLLFEETKRRGMLADDADYEKDQEQIATEAANNVLTPEVHVDPVTGMPIAVTPKHGTLNPPPPPPKKPVKVKPGEKVVMQ
jgi:hypothetical protein